MQKKDDAATKRHWHLLVFDIPVAGYFAKTSLYTWSAKRLLSVPAITTARQQRQIPDNAVLVNTAYLGLGTQYELTGTSPNPVATVTSPAYLLGLEQAIKCADPGLVVNLYSEDQPYLRQEWQQGFAAGLLIRGPDQDEEPDEEHQRYMAESS